VILEDNTPACVTHHDTIYCAYLSAGYNIWVAGTWRWQGACTKAVIAGNSFKDHAINNSHAKLTGLTADD
jgi:hypothetical protein